MLIRLSTFAKAILSWLLSWWSTARQCRGKDRIIRQLKAALRESSGSFRESTGSLSDMTKRFDELKHYADKLEHEKEILSLQVEQLTKLHEAMLGKVETTIAVVESIKHATYGTGEGE